MNYLTRWRMSLAKDRFLHSNDAIGVFAQQIGYESESAFSTAFKRIVGCALRRYVASLKVVAQADAEDVFHAMHERWEADLSRLTKVNPAPQPMPVPAVSCDAYVDEAAHRTSVDTRG